MITFDDLPDASASSGAGITFDDLPDVKPTERELINAELDKPFAPRSGTKAGRAAARLSPDNPEMAKRGPVSVMDGVTGAAPAPDGVAVSSVPVRPEFRAAVEARFNAASPGQRDLMAGSRGWAGQVAKELADRYARIDAAGAPAMKKVDQRVERRREEYIAKGMDPDAAGAMANVDAQLGRAPGGGITGNIEPTKFDFDTAEAFRKNPVLSSTLVRGVSKGGLELASGAAGVGEAMADFVFGSDSTSKSASEALRVKAEAIGESRGDFLARNLEGAISSLTSQIPSLIVGAATGSSAISLASMAYNSFGSEYLRGKQAGLDPSSSAARAGLFAAFETIGESFGLGGVLKKLGEAARGIGTTDELLKFFASNLSKEIPGELLTTTGQFGVDKMRGIGLNTEAGWSEYLKQAGDTIAQTLMQGGLQAGGTTGVATAARFLGQGDTQSAEAQFARALDESARGSWDRRGIDAAARRSLSTDPAGRDSRNVLFESAPRPPAATVVSSPQSRAAGLVDIVVPEAPRSAVEVQPAAAPRAAPSALPDATPLLARLDEAARLASSDAAGRQTAESATTSQAAAPRPAGAPAASAGFADFTDAEMRAEIGAPDAPAGTQQPATPEPAQDEVRAEWYGRRGDGYQTQGDARLQIPARRRDYPDLSWDVEALPNGRFKLVGRAGSAQGADNAPTTQGAPSAEALTRSRAAEESDQDRSRREWRENYDRVSSAPDLKQVDTASIERAANYAARVIADQSRKGWDGGAVDAALINAFRNEKAFFDAELKLRRGTGRLSNQEQRGANPVAESQAPAPEAGDGGVAPAPDGAAPDPVSVNGKPMETGTPRVDAPTKQTRADAAKKRRTDYRAKNGFMSFLGENGVSIAEMKGITGETGRRGNRMVPYFGPMFRKNGRPLDELARLAVEAGYLTQADVDSELDNGGVNKLTEMIRRAQAGESVGTASDEELAFEQRMAEFEDAGTSDLDLTPEDYEDAYGDMSADLQARAEALTAELRTLVSDDDFEATIERLAIQNESQQEYVDALEQEVAGRRAGRGSQEPEGAQQGRGTPGDRGGAQAGGSTPQEFGLEAPTAEGLRARAANEAAQQQDQTRRDAAPPAADFTLTGSDSQADQARARGQMELASGDDAGTSAPMFSRRRMAQNDAYETDLFGNPLPGAGGTAGDPRPARTEVRRDVQPAAGVPGDTEAPAGDYFVRTIVGTEARRKLGADRILTAADAAAATRYLYRSAVERFDGIVTDADGKPLAVVGGFKGALAQAAVYPATIMGEAIRVPGAARIWFSHNHPSGKAELSRADENLGQALANVFRGSGIEPMGILAVAGDEYAFAPANVLGNPERGDIPAARASVEVPVVERELSPRTAPKMESVSSPAAAKRMARGFYAQAKAPGLLLLDAQHYPTAWVPLPKEALGPLRGTGGLRALYRAISEANAGAAILVHGGEMDAAPSFPGGVSAVENIGAALGLLDVRLLDAIDATSGASFAERGMGLSAGPVYSRRGWNADFPDAVLGHRQGAAQAHPDYQAAKAGDDRSALRLARDLVTDEYVDALRAALPDGARPTIVPVLAVEAGGRNRIPLAVAKVLGGKLGFPVSTDIAQAQKVSRGGSDGFHRLSNPPTFTGQVDAGDYLILDDTLTQGGTLAQLKTHIEDNGGRVLLASALTGKGYSARISITDERLAQLRERYGSIESWWRDAFGYGFDGFTESEARFILSLRDRPVPDALRDRVAAARVRGVGDVDGRDDPDGRDRPPLSRSASPGALIAGLDAIRLAWTADGIDFTISERGGVVTVSKIVVPAAARNRGVGTRAMQQLVDFADAAGLHIALTPSADFGGSKARLKGFYRRFGFVENTGRNRVFSVSEGMVRISPNGPVLYARGSSAGLPTARDAELAATELAATERAYGGRAGWQRDRDAGRTKLTYGQWVQVRTPAFKAWFGDWEALRAQQRLDAMDPVKIRMPGERDGLPLANTGAESSVRRLLVRVNPDEVSKATDPDTGEPLVVYHGTNADEDFVAFKGPKIYFSPDPEYAGGYADGGMIPGFPIENSRVIPVYLSVQKPLDLRDMGERQVERSALIKRLEKAGVGADGIASIKRNTDDYPMFLWTWMHENSVRQAIQEAGFDAVFQQESSGGKTGDALIVFRPEQIKSATGNRGTFDPANADIRESRGGGTGLPMARVTEIADSMRAAWANAPEVVVVRDMRDPAIPQAVRDADAKQRSQGAQGDPEGFWYGGRAYLVASALASDADVVRVLAHEALGHYGLRGVFGKRLASILDQVALARIDEVRAKAAEYGLPITMGDARAVVRERQPGIAGAELEAAARTLMLDSRRQAAEEVLAVMAQRQPQLGVVQRAIAAVRAWLRETFPRLNLRLSDAEIIRDYILPARTFVERGLPQEAAGDPAFSRSKQTAPKGAVSASGQWDAPDTSRVDDVIYALQDKQVDLKRVAERIKAAGANLGIRTDGYLREELYQGRVADRTRRFLDDELRPLLTSMRLAKVGLDQLEEYLMARHAPEANAYLQSINLERSDNAALSGMSNADAAKIMAAAPPVMESLAARVDGIIAGTRDLMEISGLETSEYVEGLRRSYEFYVPLHRDDDHPGSRAAVGQGFSVRGKSAKGRTGSTARVTNILAHIVEAREATITRAEKNVVALAVYAMAKQNPNPDFWTTETPPEVPWKDERRTVFNPRTGTMDENPNYGQVVMRADPQWASRPNVLAAKFNGAPVGVIFNERDPRALRMVTSLKNLDVHSLDGAMRVMATGTRWQAMVNTALNPVFMVVNFLRDVQGAAINLTSTEVSGEQLAAIGGIGAAARAIWRAERGLPAKDPKMAALYDEFRRRGAKTGYREAFVDIEARAKALQRELDSAGSNAARSIAAVADFMATANDTVENAVRLSVYRVALEKGMHPDRAASIAKNLTVNFNRKGAKTQSIGALYAFFNAAVQGNARLVETLKGPAGKKILAGGLAIGILQALLLAGADDDDEEAIPDYVKRTSLVFPYRGGYVAIPMPLGLHVIPNVGRAVTEVAIALADGDMRKIPGQIVGLLSTVMDSMNPLSGAETPLQMIAPTLADPVVQLATNQGFSGRPIYRKRSRDDASAPGYTLGRDSTNPAYTGAAYVIHMVFSGGNPNARNIDVPAALSPQPEALRLIPETIFGGLWRETEKIVDTTIALATGQPVEHHRIPLVSRFSGDTQSDAAVAGVFWNNISRVGALEREAARAKKVGADDADIPEVGRRASAAKREVLRMMDARRRMEVDGAPRETIREVEREMTGVMREFNAEARSLRR